MLTLIPNGDIALLSKLMDKASLFRFGQSKPQLSAFSREIATWICNQEGPFATNELEKMVLSTDRPINSKLLSRVVSDVKEQIFKIDQMPDLPEVTV